MTKITDWEQEVKRNSPLSWMINADEDALVEFEIDPTTIEEVEIDLKGKLIPEYEIDMRNILCEVRKGKRVEHVMIADDGRHNLPFWASRPFREFMAEHQPTSWVAITYVRTVLPDGKNAAVFDLP